MLQVVEERRRDPLRDPVHEDRRAADARRRAALDVLEEDVDRERRLAQAPGEDLTPPLPRRHDRVDEEGDDERDPSAVPDLHDVRPEEGEVDDEERDRDRERHGLRDLPGLAGVDVEEDRRDPHRRRHRDAVGCRERAGALEREDEPDAGDGEGPVDRRQVDLPDLLLGRVGDLQARHVAELDRLPRQREGPRDDGLGGDHGGRRREEDEGEEAPLRREAEQRVGRRRRVRQEERPLPEVVEEERGEDEGEPADADRPGPEVPHVGVERLASRDDEEDRAEQQEADDAVVGEEADGVRRVDGGEDPRRVEDVRDAEHREDDEPDEHHRPEDRADARRPLLLDQEEDDEDDDDDRLDVGLERRRDDLEPLDGGEDRDGRRDDAVAVQERGAEEPERNEDEVPGAPGRRRRPQERHQREDAPLTPVVGPEDDREVLDRDRQDEGPEDQGEDPEDVLGRGRDRVVPREALPERVEGARPDVAEDDAEGAERQDREVPPLRRRRQVGLLRSRRCGLERPGGRTRWGVGGGGLAGVGLQRGGSLIQAPSGCRGPPDRSAAISASFSRKSFFTQSCTDSRNAASST